MLENKAKDLNIKSFGVTLTTLEEVFLKLAGQDKDANHSDDEIGAKVLHKSYGCNINSGTFRRCQKWRDSYQPSRPDQCNTHHNSSSQGTGLY
jgi:hypothetical protein